MCVCMYVCMCVCVYIYIYPFELVFSFVSSRYPEVELLDHMVVLFFNLGVL